MTRQRGEDTEGSVSAGRRGGTRGLEAAGEVAEAGSEVTQGGRVRGAGSFIHTQHHHVSAGPRINSGSP